jgi:hypothetical protein
MEKMMFCYLYPDTSEFVFRSGFIVMAISQMLISISMLKGVAI